MSGSLSRRRRRSWGRGLGLAAVTGLRSALGPALLVRRVRGRTGLRRLAYLFALVELVSDKLPWVPARTRPPGLAARAAGGALVGAVAGPGRGRRIRAAGLVLGAATAVAAAFIGERARRALTRLLGGGAFANGIAGTLEDTGAVALGALVDPA
jgi:uncharacterized membrane protein